MSVYDHLEFRHLRYILAVAEEGSFTAAAAKLHVAQSAISTQIRALEDVLEIRIFERDRDGVTLTTEGEVLVGFAREGLQTREHIIQTLRAIRLGTLLPLRLGLSPFIQKGLLGSVSDLYKKMLPHCEIMPESGDTEELTKWVRQDSLDAAIVTLPISSDDLQVNVLERERLVVCMRSDDPLTEYDAVPAAALDNKLKIFAYQRHHPAAYLDLVERLKEMNVTLRTCKPTLNLDHVQWMVREGACYSFIRVGRPLLNGLVTRPIAGAEWTIDSALVSRIGNRHPALSLFIRELNKHFRQTTQIPERKPVLSVKIAEVSKRKMIGKSSANQQTLFALQDGQEQERHIQKTSRHRKEVLDE